MTGPGVYLGARGTGIGASPGTGVASGAPISGAEVSGGAGGGGAIGPASGDAALVDTAYVYVVDLWLLPPKSVQSLSSAVAGPEGLVGE